jgi:inosose dehydratase
VTDLAERVAGAPITWGVCEVPGWGYQMPPDRVLSEMRSLGLRATELGPDGFLPRGSERALLEAHGLSLVAGFVPAVLHDPSSLERELAKVDAVAGRISALGGSVLVLAASTGGTGYEEAGRLDASGWTALGRGILRAAASAGERGIRLAVHPHHGTVVERPEDVERLLGVPGVGLCLDTGHVMLGGGDPVALARSAGSRVIHVHLKDVDAALAGRVAAGDLGYHAAVRDGLYRPLGDGDVDVRAVLRAVEESAGTVWYVLEHDEVLDHEPEPGSGPLLNARRSLAFLERAWEEVGSTAGR